MDEGWIWFAIKLYKYWIKTSAYNHRKWHNLVWSSITYAIRYLYGNLISKFPFILLMRKMMHISSIHFPCNLKIVCEKQNQNLCANCLITYPYIIAWTISLSNFDFYMLERIILGSDTDLDQTMPSMDSHHAVIIVCILVFLNTSCSLQPSTIIIKIALCDDALPIQYLLNYEFLYTILLYDWKLNPN